MTAKRMISGEVLKYRNGSGISGDYETRIVSASHFALTMPTDALNKEGRHQHIVPVSALCTARLRQS